MMSFGRLIGDARKRKNLSLRELAAIIKKEDGQPISPQYLNDIEHDRRNPPSEHIIRQFAQELDIDVDVLLVRAGEFPEDVRNATATATDQTLLNAVAAFRKALREEDQ